MATYIVDGNLDHDNTAYKTGDSIEMSEDQAAPLIKLGRLKLADPKSEEPETPAEADQTQPPLVQTPAASEPQAPSQPSSDPTPTVQQQAPNLNPAQLNRVEQKIANDPMIAGDGSTPSASVSQGGDLNIS